MKSLLSKILVIITFPIWSIILLIMAIIYIFSEDDAKAIAQGIGKGYTEEDLKDYYRRYPNEK